MKNAILIACISLLFVSSSFGTVKHSVEVTIKNLKDTEIVVKVSDVAQKKQLLDTVIRCENGIFTFDNKFSEPVYITFVPKSGLIDTKRIRGVVERGTMRIGIYAVTGETYIINGALEGDVLYYDVVGSEINSVLSKQRNKYIEAEKYFDMESEYFRDDRSKIQRDSVYYIGEALQVPLKKERLQYIQSHLDSPLSALFLSEFSTTIFNEYYNKIGENVRNSIFKPLLESQKRYADLLNNNIKMSIGADEIDFTLRGLDGDSLTLSKLKGGYVVLYFWGSWCRWCIQGIPNLNKLYDNYGDKVKIIGIACSDREPALRKAIKENSIQWDNYMDTARLSFKYGIKGYPTKILLNPEGKIVLRYEGEYEEFYKKTIEFLRDGKK